MEVSVCFYAQRLLLAGGGFCDARKCSNPKEKEGKKMKQRKLILILAIVLSVAIAAGGTMAYLQDTDEDVNVMTLGNVYITQNEQERNEAGELVPFTQEKPMYPAVYEDSEIGYADKEDWPVPDDQAWQMLEDNENVIDKIVTVTNTGKSPAYVRTLIALEGTGKYGPNYADGAMVKYLWCGSEVGDRIAAAFEGEITVDGVDYTVISFTYVNELAPGETTIPSLKQLYLSKDAGNEEMEYYGEYYDVLVLSQAVQTQGFEDQNENGTAADEALNTAFGKADVTENLIKWFSVVGDNVGSPGKDWPNNNPPVIGDAWDGTTDVSWYNDTDTEFVLTTAEELAGLAELVNGGNDFKGKTIKLGESVNLQNKEWTPIANEEKKAFEGTFDGQGNSIMNLSINDEDGVDSALFGYAGNAEIKGINVVNVSIDAYSEAAAILGYGEGTTISDCHVRGKINIVTEWAYVGGIAAHGYMDVKDCSVIATGTGVIKSETRNAVGGICGWVWEGNHKVTGCEVANMEITGWTNVGCISGFIHYSNVFDGNTAKNVVLTKTREGGNPGIGLAAGGYSYNAGKPSTITNNTFENIEMNGQSIVFAAYDIMHGSEYGGTASANFVMSGNVQTNITDNTTIYNP